MENELMDMETQLLRMTLFVSAGQTTMQIHEWCGEEKPNTFKVQLARKHDPNFIDRITRMIKKHELMVVESPIYNSVEHVGYRVWCKPEDRESAKQLLIEQVTNTIDKMKSSMDDLYNQFHNSEMKLKGDF
jgi:hypothetical protein